MMSDNVLLFNHLAMNVIDDHKFLDDDGDDNNNSFLWKDDDSLCMVEEANDDNDDNDGDMIMPDFVESCSPHVVSALMNDASFSSLITDHDNIDHGDDDVFADNQDGFANDNHDDDVSNSLDDYIMKVISPPPSSTPPTSSDDFVMPITPPTTLRPTVTADVISSSTSMCPEVFTRPSGGVPTTTTSPYPSSVVSSTSSIHTMVSGDEDNFNRLPNSHELQQQYLETLHSLSMSVKRTEMSRMEIIRQTALAGGTLPLIMARARNDPFSEYLMSISDDSESTE